MNWRYMFRSKNANDLVSTIKFCIGLSWAASPKYTTLRIIFNITISIVPIILAKITQSILDGLIENQGEFAYFIVLISIFSVLKITQGVAEKYGAYIESMHSELMQQRCSEILLEKAVDADLEMYDTPRYYDIFTETQRNMQALTTISWNILEAVGSIVAFLTTIAILCGAKVYYAAAMVLVSIPSAIVSAKYIKSLYQNDLQQINNIRQQNYLFHVGTSQNYAQEIRCYDLASVIKSKYRIIFDDIFSSKQKILENRVLSNVLLMAMAEAVILILTIQIAYQVYLGRYSIGDYSMYTNMLIQLNATLAMLVMRIMAVYENKIKADFMTQLSEIAKSKIVSGKMDLKRIERLEFDDVCFAYPGSSKYVVKHVSFVLNPNTKTALIGVNGAGKSTIIKLLLRLYDVDSGSIRINNHDIKEYDIRALRKQIGVYTQNSAIFDWRLGQNISIRNDDYDEKRCKKALLKCGGKDILNKCDGCLDTYLGHTFSEAGIELSIGQKQKVALARTFYHEEQSVCVLDEPSSALDPETEKEVFENIDEMSKDRIVLFTSHRMSTINMTDYVIVLEDGEIIEEGTRNSLLESKGRFYQLYSCQK